jgi:ribosome biogenesis SPOUT family RNA methylase Rps3
MEDLISKPNFSQAAVSFMQEANVNLLGILTMVIQNDQPVRELLLIGDRQTVESMTSYLLHNDNASILDMKADSDVSSPTEIIDEDVVIMKLKQGNSKGSRKQVAPIMMSYF